MDRQPLYRYLMIATLGTLSTAALAHGSAQTSTQGTNPSMAAGTAMDGLGSNALIAESNDATRSTGSSTQSPATSSSTDSSKTQVLSGLRLHRTLDRHFAAQWRHGAAWRSA